MTPDTLQCQISPTNALRSSGRGGVQRRQSRPAWHLNVHWFMLYGYSRPLQGHVLTTYRSGVLGFILVIVIAACVDPEISNVTGTAFGQPMAQIYYDALGKQGALGFMSFMFIVQYLMGLSILVASSRQTWAFSRDGALPLSSFFRPIVSFLSFEKTARTNIRSLKDSVTFPYQPSGAVFL